MAPPNRPPSGPSFVDGSGSRSNNISRASTTCNGISGTTASTPFEEILKQNPQIVSDRYAKREKLARYLESTYKTRPWAVHYKAGNFYIIAPDVLSDVSGIGRTSEADEH